MAKNCSLAVCHVFNIDRNAIERLELSVQKNIEPLLLSVCSSVWTAAVFNSEFKTIHPFEQQRFSVQQREFDQIQLFVTL